MGLLAENILTDVLVLILTLATIIYTYFHYAYQYWQKKGVPFLEPTFPRGNNPTLFRKATGFTLESMDFYEETRKKGVPFAGIYTVYRPVLVVVDPNYIRDILTQDFQHFVDRGHYHNEKYDPISAHLFAIDGIKWKNMRTRLTPAYSSGKMKMMFHTVLECSDYMIEAITKSAESHADIDMKEFAARFTTDVIGICAFGIACNSFKDPEAEFRQMGVNIFKTSDRMFKYFCIGNFPKLSKKLGLVDTPKYIADFFIDVVEKIVKYREDNNISQKDFLQQLIDLKRDSKDTDDPFTIKQLAAQVFIFFIAGFDTSSTALSFALYELSRNPDMQEKVRTEMIEVLERHEGEITYENLGEMKYLQQVLDETLRLYPPVLNLTRVCVKEYKLRDTDIIIENGTPILIPIFSLHRDAEYYPDPEKFDPERFNNENKTSRQPFVYLPFGEGQRNCIGLRFGIMQWKIGLIKILTKFRISISPKTNIPLKINKEVFLLEPTERLYLRAEKI